MEHLGGKERERGVGGFKKGQSFFFSVSRVAGRGIRPRRYCFLPFLNPLGPKDLLPGTSNQFITHFSPPSLPPLCPGGSRVRTEREMGIGSDDDANSGKTKRRRPTYSLFPFLPVCSRVRVRGI